MWAARPVRAVTWLLPAPRRRRPIQRSGVGRPCWALRGGEAYASCSRNGFRVDLSRTPRSRSPLFVVQVTRHLPLEVRIRPRGASSCRPPWTVFVWFRQDPARNPRLATRWVAAMADQLDPPLSPSFRAYTAREEKTRQLLVEAAASAPIRKRRLQERAAILNQIG